MSKIIPKVIHFCWFGGGQKPEIVKRCMASWAKRLPDYELMEWNESNFNIDLFDFTRQAYNDKNYAFVSDAARAFVLNEFGGIYLDTDVEVFKNFDDLLDEEFFAGFEQGGYIGTCVMGAQKNAAILKEYLDYYSSLSYWQPDGKKHKDTNVVLLTKLLEEKGIKKDDSLQRVEGITVFPRTYFSPYDYINGENFISSDSYCVHHFAKLWLPRRVRLKAAIKKIVIKIVGPETLKALRQKL
ncbi:MAG: glycosyltransferase family 32 protein [Acutalibacteraceae bacterium]